MSEIINYGKVVVTIDGEWDSKKPYDRLCIVTYNGLSYLSITDGLVGTPPPNSSNWKLLSVKGDKGSKGDQGPKGSKGDKGDPGINAIQYRNITVFKTSESRPTINGGEWDIENNILTLPEGWSTEDELVAPVWMSIGTFSSLNPTNPQWTVPVKITGEKGNNGADSNNGEFIYCLTKNQSVQPPTITNVNEDGYVPTGWTPSPTGISETSQVEWFAYRKKDDEGNWMNFEDPAIWAKWGVDGLDGDGVQYIYRVNNGSALRNPIEEFNIDINSDEYQQLGEFQDIEYIPTDWTDNPSGVDSTNTHEWCCKRKFRNGKWEAYSNPSLWSKYGKDGTDGTNGIDGENGISILVKYAKTDSSSVIPTLNKTNKNPGSNWSSIIPTFNSPEALWEIQAYVDYKGNLVKISTSEGEVYGWCDPILKSGVAGENGVVPNYKSTYYCKADSIPNKPTYTKLSDVEASDTWLDYPNDSGQWWQSTALIDGVSEEIISWGNVLQVNGQDGDAQDGKYWETRFAASNDDSIPEIDKSKRDPSTSNVTWIKVDGNTPPPTIPEGGSLWQTWAELQPGGSTLVNAWSDPYRINGERGPRGYQGATGEPGPAGASGIPGVSIDVLYCLGTETKYNANSAPNGNSYEGWYWNVPDVTETYKYIWCSQGKKVYTDNTGENYTYEWGTPFRLSGLNGLGEKGVGIVDVKNYYAVNNSSTKAPNKSDYGEEGVIPTLNENTPYLWNYEVIEYSDNTKKETTPQVISVVGANGRNIIEIVEYYLISDKETGITIEDNSWSTEPIYPNDTTPYLWNYEEVIFDKGESIKTDPIRIGNYSKGEKGAIGKTIYPAGIYNNSISYKTTETTCPYVLDTTDGNYYILNADKWEAGQYITPSQSYESNPNLFWTKMDFYEAIFAKIGIINNGLFGSAVFNGDYMFSQQGIDVAGVYSANYELFNPNDPYNASNAFRPNICINFKTGEIWLSAGKVNADKDGNVSMTGKITAEGGSKLGAWFTWADGTISTKENADNGLPMIQFNPDGSGHLCNKNISWDTNGNLFIGGLNDSDETTPPTVTIGDGAWVTTADGSVKAANNNALFNKDGSGYLGGIDENNNYKGLSWNKKGDVTLHGKALMKPVFIELDSEVSESVVPTNFNVTLEESVYIFKNPSIPTFGLNDGAIQEVYQRIYISWFTNTLNSLLKNGETFNCTIINHSDAILSFYINNENVIIPVRKVIDPITSVSNYQLIENNTYDSEIIDDIFQFIYVTPGSKLILQIEKYNEVTKVYIDNISDFKLTFNEEGSTGYSRNIRLVSLNYDMNTERNFLRPVASLDNKIVGNNINNNLRLNYSNIIRTSEYFERSKGKLKFYPVDILKIDYNNKDYLQLSPYPSYLEFEIGTSYPYMIQHCINSVIVNNILGYDANPIVINISETTYTKLQAIIYCPDADVSFKSNELEVVLNEDLIFTFSEETLNSLLRLVYNSSNVFYDVFCTIKGIE